MDATITRQLVADDQRTNITADLFGVYFPLQLEPFVYAITSKLSEDYPDGHPNSPTFGHFKIPHPDERVTVQ